MQQYWPDKDVLLAGQQALASKAPSDKLLAYLKEYQQDLLTTGTPQGLPNFATQRNILIALMRQKYVGGQGYHQTVGGRTMGLPKFWELVLSMDFVSHEIELINNIGYDEGELFSGIRSTVPSPYAEFVIIGEELKLAVSSEDDHRPFTTQEGRVFMQGRVVCITISGDKTYEIKELEENGPYHKFMNYLLAPENTDIDLSLEDIRGIKGLKATRDLSDIARYCGFNKKLKKAFIPVSKSDRLRFISRAQLDNEQVEAIKNQAAKLRATKRK